MKKFRLYFTKTINNNFKKYVEQTKNWVFSGTADKDKQLNKSKKN